MSTVPSAEPARFADLFTPKLVTALREGYSLATLGRDAMAGLTVAIVALPLAMAIAIASGAPPQTGLVTAVVAGFLISALGGSRFQIGGPTAAFIVVVFSTIERHGYDGLLLATLMAGGMLVVVGLLRLGTYIRYIPHPVIVGFTTGIAITIFVSEIKDLLGLEVTLGGEFTEKIGALAGALPTASIAAIGVAAVSLAIILTFRRLAPRLPGFLIAVVVASVGVAILGLDAPTIGSVFGGVPAGFPAPELPSISFEAARAVLPDAITIAILAGVESLLSAVVADGMTGRRHRPNSELVAQGIANIGSALFGGLSATGAIARTATNIRAGAKTPVAGMLHAVFLLLFMLVGSSALSYIPLAALAAILVVVAWNIAEFGHVRQILTGSSNGDRTLLLVTLLLTVFADLTVAIEAGIVLASFLFMHRMANSVVVARVSPAPAPDRSFAAADATPDPDTVVFRIDGPFFFGATTRLATTLERIGPAPRTYVLDLSAVPFMDSTAARTLESFVRRATERSARVVLTGARPEVIATLRDYHLLGRVELAEPRSATP